MPKLRLYKIYIDANLLIYKIFMIIKNDFNKHKTLSNTLLLFFKVLDYYYLNNESKIIQIHSKILKRELNFFNKAC